MIKTDYFFFKKANLLGFRFTIRSFDINQEAKTKWKTWNKEHTYKVYPHQTSFD